MSDIEKGLESIAAAVTDGAKALNPAPEDRLARIELGIKAMEINFLKSTSDFQMMVKEHFSRQETSNQLLASATDRLSNTIEKSFQEVFESAMQRNHIPTDMVKLIVKVLSSIILALGLALVFVLTGLQAGWLPNFHTPQFDQTQIEALKKIARGENGK